MPSKNSHTSARRPSGLVSTLLLAALLLSAAPLRAPAATQESQRERRVTTQTPAATPTPTPRARVQATPTPTPARPSQTPAPVATPTPQPTVAAPQTLEELRARIREILARPEFAASRLAIKVASLDT